MYCQRQLALGVGSLLSGSLFGNLMVWRQDAHALASTTLVTWMLGPAALPHYCYTVRSALFRRLEREHADAFKHVVREKFAPACEAYGKDPSVAWPAALRVKTVRSAPGIREMTWSFTSRDGRATFEMVTVDGEVRCRWRVGDHEVFEKP